MKLFVVYVSRKRWSWHNFYMPFVTSSCSIILSHFKYRSTSTCWVRCFLNFTAIVASIDASLLPCPWNDFAYYLQKLRVSALIYATRLQWQFNIMIDSLTSCYSIKFLCLPTQIESTWLTYGKLCSFVHLHESRW